MGTLAETRCWIAYRRILVDSPQRCECSERPPQAVAGAQNPAREGTIGIQGFRV